MENLNEILEQMNEVRVEAIYNKEYRYIKEIVWDDEANKKYGTSREGYEQYQKDNTNLYATFTNIESLRRMQTRDANKTDVKYFIEAKREVNTQLGQMFDLYNKARAELVKILNVKDEEAFNYYIDEHVIGSGDFRLGANELKSRVTRLIQFVDDYNNDEYLKRVIDKIKD